MGLLVLKELINKYLSNFSIKLIGIALMNGSSKIIFYVQRGLKTKELEN